MNWKRGWQSVICFSSEYNFSQWREHQGQTNWNFNSVCCSVFLLYKKLNTVGLMSEGVYLWGAWDFSGVDIKFGSACAESIDDNEETISSYSVTVIDYNIFYRVPTSILI